MADLEDREIAAEPVRTSPPDSELPAEELLDRLRRERADFLNCKHRVAHERAQDAERARAEAVRRLLPVLDELERALGQPPSDLSAHPWVQGIALTHRTIAEALRELGIERIGAEGEPFDPQRHEARFCNALTGATDQSVATCEPDTGWATCCSGRRRSS